MIDISLEQFRKPVIPTPAMLIDAVEQCVERGNLEKLALLPCVSFFMSGDAYGIDTTSAYIRINPDVSIYLSRFRKAYSAFYENFNPQNYQLIK